VSTVSGEGPGFRLDGQHALVTGAGRGIGRSCVHALVDAGATVTAVARSEGQLETVVAEVGARGGQAHAFAADVRDPDQVDRAVRAASEHGDLSICVNSAGLNRTGPTHEYDVADFDLVLETNLRGTFLVCRSVGAVLLARGRGGRIVNVSSQMGSVGYPGRAAYCASKHAVNGLTKALAVEWAPHGVTVNAVAPTFIQTPMTESMLADETFRADVLRRIPLGRIGQVDEVAAAVVFLASPAASLITGEVLAVDGGWVAQ
jgi:NAD(P)-dependent dehydrogenase (short-subunit alcohol dehydrogenase family)